MLDGAIFEEEVKTFTKEDIKRHLGIDASASVTQREKPSLDKDPNSDDAIVMGQSYIEVLVKA